MLLKRHYNHAAPKDDWVTRLDGEIEVLIPPLSHITIRHTGTHATQHFSTRFVARGMEEGWLTIEGEMLVLATTPESLRYAIQREPGAYCCHCDQRLPGGGALAQAHVRSQHKGQVSPDMSNPSGYAVLNHYACVLDAEQHARWKVPVNATVSHWRGE